MKPRKRRARHTTRQPKVVRTEDLGDRSAARQAVKEKERDLRRSIIFNGALKAFVQKGVDETTMDDIAAMVGLSKATLYKSFPSKESLYVALATTLLKNQIDLLEAFRGDTSLTARARVEKSLRTLLMTEGSFVNGETSEVPLSAQVLSAVSESEREGFMKDFCKLLEILDGFLQAASSVRSNAPDAATLFLLLQGFRRRTWFIETMPGSTATQEGLVENAVRFGMSVVDSGFNLSSATERHTGSARIV